MSFQTTPDSKVNCIPSFSATTGLITQPYCVSPLVSLARALNCIFLDTVKDWEFDWGVVALTPNVSAPSTGGGCIVEIMEAVCDSTGEEDS